MMHNMRRFFIFLVCLIGLSLTIYAGNAKAINKSHKKALISFDVRNADIKDVLSVLARVSGLNIITSDEVKGTLTMRLENVPWDQALNLILTQKGLSCERIGNVLRITTSQRYISEKQAKRRTIEEEKESERQKRSITAVIKLNYAKADYARDIITKLVYGKGVKPGLIVADVTNNSIIIRDIKENIIKIKRIVKDIDIQRKQVEINARVVQVSKPFERQLGIRWGGNYLTPSGKHTYVGIGGAHSLIEYVNPTDGISPVPGTTNYIVNLPTTMTAGTLGLAIGNVRANYNLDLQLEMAQNQGYSKIISTPRIITLDNEEANIKSGLEIPYQEKTGEGNTSVTFKEAVLKLEVTPHIAHNNKIVMEIKVTKDSPDWANVIGATGEPPIKKNEVTSTVVVDNGQTIVIGGLIEETKSKSVTGVPGLMTIPLLGWLFKSEILKNPHDELLVFVTPKIVSSP
jgi:type IV pilus assembly protein PilQ